MLHIKCFEFNMFGVNTYVVWDDITLQAAVVDPGMISERDNKALDDFIGENKLKVVHLLNTHLHIDHTLGDDYVRSRYGVKVSANKADEFLGRARDGQARMFGLNIPGLSPLDVEVELKQGERVMLGEDFMEILEVPGHSPGSVVLYAPSGDFVITGDVLFRRSIGRTDLPGGSHSTLIAGIRERLLQLPDSTVVYPGHGPSTTIGEERVMNPMI